jgi:hypothetical protein
VIDTLSPSLMPHDDSPWPWYTEPDANRLENRCCQLAHRSPTLPAVDIARTSSNVAETMR